MSNLRWLIAPSWCRGKVKWPTVCFLHFWSCTVIQRPSEPGCRLILKGLINWQVIGLDVYVTQLCTRGNINASVGVKNIRLSNECNNAKLIISIFLVSIALHNSLDLIIIWMFLDSLNSGFIFVCFETLPGVEIRIASVQCWNAKPGNHSLGGYPMYSIYI